MCIRDSGVIVDSEPLHKESFLQIWKELGYENNHGIHFPDFYGTSDRTVWKAFIDKHQPKMHIDELILLRKQRLIKLLRDKKPIFDGVLPLIQHLASYCPIGLATGSVHHIIDEILKSGIKIVYVHARNAILNGVSPKGNRTIPPLNYEFVKKIKSNSLLNSKKVIIIGVPGAFTKDCSAKHIPGYALAMKKRLAFFRLERQKNNKENILVQTMMALLLV